MVFERAGGLSVPRRYIHSMAIDGVSFEADTDELQSLVEQAVGLGMTRQTFEDALVKGTGFEKAVRDWFRIDQSPNGLCRERIDAAQLAKSAHVVGEVLHADLGLGSCQADGSHQGGGPQRGKREPVRHIQCGEPRSCRRKK